MRKDLRELGRNLHDAVPFHPIVREFEAGGNSYRLSVGWKVRNGADIQRKLRDGDWGHTNWSVVPRSKLARITKEIKAEADLMMKEMDTFIETECEKEMGVAITRTIVHKTEPKDRHEIFRVAMTNRVGKLREHITQMPRPNTFSNFIIRRTFAVPKPSSVDDKTWKDCGDTITVEMKNQNLVSLGKNIDSTEFALKVLMTFPQIAEFCLRVGMQLAHLAKEEKKGK